MESMEGIPRGNVTAFAERFDFSPYRTLVDIGGATGLLSSIVAAHHRHITARSCDLPVLRPIAECRIAARGLAGRDREPDR
jgi:hypothetical protein